MKQKDSKVVFANDVTTYTLPSMEPDLKIDLWWSAKEMAKFRKRNQIQQNLKSKISTMTLVVTNDFSRREFLVSFLSGGCNEHKYVTCCHMKVEKALSGLNLQFAQVIIDSADVTDFEHTETLVRLHCPTAYAITVHTDEDDSTSTCMLHSLF